MELRKRHFLALMASAVATVGVISLTPPALAKGNHSGSDSEAGDDDSGPDDSGDDDAGDRSDDGSDDSPETGDSSEPGDDDKDDDKLGMSDDNGTDDDVSGSDDDAMLKPADAGRKVAASENADVMDVRTRHTLTGTIYQVELRDPQTGKHRTVRINAKTGKEVGILGF